MMNNKQRTRFGLALRLARIRAGVGQETAAERTGVSQPTVSRWERGRSLPDSAQLGALLKVVSAERQIRAQFESLVAANSSLNEALLDARLDGLLGYYLARNLEDDLVEIPLYADIAAGLGEFQIALEQPRSTIPVPADVFRRDPAAYALRVVGNSMQPLIREGDVLVISPNSAVVDGCIVAACVEPEGDVVKLYRELPEGRIALHSLNPEYSDIVLEPGSGRQARIWGRVVMQQREL